MSTPITTIITATGAATIALRCLDSSTVRGRSVLIATSSDTNTRRNSAIMRLVVHVALVFVVIIIAVPKEPHNASVRHAPIPGELAVTQVYASGRSEPVASLGPTVVEVALAAVRRRDVARCSVRDRLAIASSDGSRRQSGLITAIAGTVGVDREALAVFGCVIHLGIVREPVTVSVARRDR